MNCIVKFGCIALSLTLIACSAKQAPQPPPPLSLVTKARQSLTTPLKYRRTGEPYDAFPVERSSTL